jgi:hypothetical protein
VYIVRSLRRAASPRNSAAPRARFLLPLPPLTPPVQVEFHVSRDNGQSWGYASTEHRLRCRSLRRVACLLLASDDWTVQRGGAVGAG